ncbi:MAG: group II intron reverse transcriptase/maturase [Kofleriaceae bacterium]|nr:group II intron reverse transcriptase/maturase [Kofleriaceae bacterium]
MEEVVAPDNIARAMKRVTANHGSPGIDRMTVDELPDHWRRHEGILREQLLAGTYKPTAVRRVTIPKPDGGERELGIPTVTDRLVQQAILQVLGPRYDAGFSQHSHGFRPGHSAHDAVLEAQSYIQEGYDWVVDVDLERFFDRVNHDVLMGRLAKRIADKRMLKILRGFLNAGVMLNGVVVDQEEGTPQGGPLSPLLANVLLDELDKSLEARGHRFVRYADDCNIYVRSQRAGERVMASMRKELTKLRLRINEAKSAVDRPWNRRFLGFTFTRGRETRRRVSPRAVEKAKDRIRALTNRNRGTSITTVVKELTQYLRGWLQYFGLCQVPRPRRDLDEWIRARLRLLQVKQWKRGTTAYPRLVAMGAYEAAAIHTAQNLRRWWHSAHSPGMSQAMPIRYFDGLGLPRLA